jgi:leucyl-tRNA synthetase
MTTAKSVADQIWNATVGKRLNTTCAELDAKRADKNIVVMFPYPSGDGLHVGHAYNYAVIDSLCRWYRYKGLEVFQPFGYDAFGLPAENYARQMGGDPRTITYANIAKFREQMARMNTQYEERLITSDPSYVKWTQWLFLALLERGLAYKAEGEVNFCRSCDTTLANEQVRAGPLGNVGICERCGNAVDKRIMNQWYFKITDYKDRLMKNLFAAPGEPNYINYPASTKRQQAAWIENLRDWCVSRQRKWGCPIPVDGESDTLDTFVDSSFYFLRYLTDSETEFLPYGRYRPVDLYVGGSEHACMHLIYARFIHMVLFDMGIVSQEEPFNKVVHQGMITRAGNKMSKRFGNAVNPDEYDPDVLRMHLMFIGPYDEGGDWNDKHIVGVAKFLRRMAKWFSVEGEEEIDLTPVGRQDRARNRTAEVQQGRFYPDGVLQQEQRRLAVTVHCRASGAPAESFRPIVR